MKNSQCSYSISSPHRFFIYKYCGQKFHHKKFRLVTKLHVKKRKCDKESYINKHRKKTKKARKTGIVGSKTRKRIQGNDIPCNFRCDSCKKPFITKKMLHNHKRICTNEHSVCTICQKRTQKKGHIMCTSEIA